MFLTFRMLFRKEGTSTSVLALALLVAVLASMSCVVNHIKPLKAAEPQKKPF